MSKIGNRRVEIQETAAYRLGWARSERGDTNPRTDKAYHPKAHAWREAYWLGWDDYHAREQSA